MLLGHEHVATTAHFVARFHEDDRALVAKDDPRSHQYKAFKRWQP